VSRFLLASTNAVVGDVGTTAITESCRCDTHAIRATKAACEMLLSGVRRGLRYGDMRCGSAVYGPGMAHGQLRRKLCARRSRIDRTDLRRRNAAPRLRPYRRWYGVCCSIGKVAMPEG
jgi:nucleoside-diphosphate-sugar epimerase